MTSVNRVTESGINTLLLGGLSTNMNAIQQLQEQLSSGKSINKPSDDPVGTISAMLYRSESSRNDQYGRNANDATGWLDLADSTMTDTLNQMQRVRQLIVSGMNATSDSDAHAAQAAEVDGISQSLLANANTTYLNRPIFGGNTAGSIAYDNTGTYVGDTGAVTRTIGPNQNVQVNVPGSQVFGSLFPTMTAISSDLRSGSTASLGNDLDALDSVMQSMQTHLANIGSVEKQVTTAQTNTQSNAVSIASSLSNVEDTDLPKAVMQLQMQQVAYQAALGAASKVISESLVNFLQ